MPRIHHWGKHEVLNILNTVGDAVYTRIGVLNITAWVTSEQEPWEKRQTGTQKTLQIGSSWGRLFDCAWFRFTGTIPPEGDRKHVVLLLDVNGELCIVDREGNPVQGLTNKSSTYAYHLGKPGKWVYDLNFRAEAGTSVEVWADAGCNDLFGELKGDGTVLDAHIAVCRDDLKALYYDFEVLTDWLQHGNPENARYQRIWQQTCEAAACLRTLDEQEVRRARAILADILEKPSANTALNIGAVGHGHLDLGWLWPIRETKRKGARTFATALAMIDRYPGYVFGASQYQLFQWMKTGYPALYRRIKAAVKNGSIEPQGCAWVEADLNCSGGEALIRQILYGIKFLRMEFGCDTTYLWQPDVFGFNGAMPQLLKKSGIRFMGTQKLSWNLINTYPHHSFIWKGIDGSEVLVHLFPEDNYNSPAAPRSVIGIEKDYKDRDVSSHALMVFGIGDGGAGPGEEHLERLMRIKNTEGLPPVTLESAGAFFEKWAQDADYFATWSGEMYLERHQGTYTTQARNKRFNRKMEFALREAEWLAALCESQADVAYPYAELEEIWKEVLLYQFHDILPGSSIRRVYEESLERYRVLLDQTEQIIAQRLNALEQRIQTSQFTNPLLVVNSLSWDRRELLKTEQGWIKIDVPAMGYAVVEQRAISVENGDIEAEPQRLENALVCALFSVDGRLVSLVDKATHEEFIRPGKSGNDLSIYEDLGDAWDIPLSYRIKPPERFELVNVTAEVDGPKGVIRQEYHYGQSALTIEIGLLHNSRRLDFVCQLDWRETQKMLRTGFPVNILATEAVCDIQYGAIKRPTHSNTSWDMAKDEVAAHKWIDISDATHGLALLNDCKYGHRVKDNVLEINLVRSAPYPGANIEDVNDPDYAKKRFTDITRHQFTYALYSHTGRYDQGGVVKAAYELNVPVRSIAAGVHDGNLPSQQSFLTLDNPAVAIETVKLAETSKLTDTSADIIVRLYETSGGTHRARLHSNIPIRHASLVNLLEEEGEDLPVVNQSVILKFGPYEIHTIRLQH